MRKLQTLLFLVIALLHGFAGGAYAQSAAAAATGWSALVAGIAKSPAFLMRNAASSLSICQVN